MLDKLSGKILQLILEQKSLNLRDLLNLSSTCSYIRRFILSNNALWKNRYLEKWSDLSENYPEIDDYFEEIRHVHKIRRNVDKILMYFATNFMRTEQLSDSDFVEFIEMINLRHLNREYIEHYLREIFNDKSEIKTYDVVSLKTPGNLTLKYYSLVTLHYLRHVYLENAWTQFSSFKEDWLLEIGAILLAQWFKPQCDIKIENVRNRLDLITEEVKKHLKTNHPIFITSEDDLRMWRNKNIYENKFSSSDCKEILEAMREVLYKTTDICDNESVDFGKNQFITDCLESKRGGRINLAIIYQSVARRLGVNLEIVETDVYSFLLRFVEHDTEKKEIYYIDVFKQGKIYNDLIFEHPILKASTRTVIDALINGVSFILTSRKQAQGQRVLLIRSVLELNHVIKPHDLRITRALAKYYMKYNIDTTTLIQFIQTQNYTNLNIVKDILRILSRRRCIMATTNSTHLRYQNLKFAVGMVMKHKLLEANNTCVIYSWDRFCKTSSTCKREKNMNQLEDGRMQPFYHVLFEDGTKCCVAQENLIFSGVKNGLDENPEVGRFFTHFIKNQYVPNCVKNAEYPNDSTVRMNFQLET